MTSVVAGDSPAAFDVEFDPRGGGARHTLVVVSFVI